VAAMCDVRSLPSLGGADEGLPRLACRRTASRSLLGGAACCLSLFHRDNARRAARFFGSGGRRERGRVGGALLFLLASGSRSVAWLQQTEDGAACVTAGRTAACLPTTATAGAPREGAAALLRLPAARTTAQRARAHARAALRALPRWAKDLLDCILCRCCFCWASGRRQVVCVEDFCAGLRVALRALPAALALLRCAEDVLLCGTLHKTTFACETTSAFSFGCYSPGLTYIPPSTLLPAATLPSRAGRTLPVAALLPFCLRRHFSILMPRLL